MATGHKMSAVPGGGRRWGLSPEPRGSLGDFPGDSGRGHKVNKQSGAKKRGDGAGERAKVCPYEAAVGSSRHLYCFFTPFPYFLTFQGTRAF